MGRKTANSLKWGRLTLLSALALVLVMGSSLPGRTQTKIQILDARDRTPLPNAHVTYSSLNGAEKQTILTNPLGEIVVPIEFSANHTEFRLKVSYIGYENRIEVFKNQPEIQLLLEPLNQQLGDVVVTAQYRPGNPEKAVHKIRVIGPEKIQGMAAMHLSDVLANETHIRLSQDNILGSSLSIQGLSGENVKILIDGVPVIGRLDGNIDLSQINIHDIERIEIIEGPMSVNFGTNALAGTINLITRKIRPEKWSTGFSGYTDNTGTYDGLVFASLKREKADVSLSLGRNYFDGWSPTDQYWPEWKKTPANHLRNKSWKPREQYFGRFQAFRSFGSFLTGWKSELFSEEIINRGLPISPYLEKAFDDHYRTLRMDQAITSEGNIGSAHRLNFVVSYDYYQRIKNTYRKDLTTLTEVLSTNPGDQDTAAYRQWMSRAGLSKSDPGSPFKYELGYDLSHELAKGERIVGKRQYMGDYSLYSSAEIQFTENLIARPGIRITHNTKYPAPISPALNLKWSKGSTALRFSYARGFRAPSIKELYFSFVDINHNIKGNTDLVSENSHNFNTFYSWKTIREQRVFQVEGSCFFNSITNMIHLAAQSGSSDNLFSYTNIGKHQTAGGSLGFSWMRQHFKGSLTYSTVGYLATGLEEEPASKTRYSHEIQSNLSYEWKEPGISAHFYYKYQGKIPGFRVNDLGETENTSLGAYHMAEITLGRKLWRDRMQLSTGLKNLFGVTDIQSMMSEGVHSGGDSTMPIGMGRVFFIKLDLQLSQM